MTLERCKAPCPECPFNASGKGRFIRETLSAGRWDVITREVKEHHVFHCHVTAHAYDSAMESGGRIPAMRICAGAIAYALAEGVRPSWLSLVEAVEEAANQCR